MAILHICTTNDHNGNPRRLFVQLDPEGAIVRGKDEGYEGRPSWALDAVRIEVAPSEWRRWMHKWAAAPTRTFPQDAPTCDRCGRKVHEDPCEG